MTHWPIHACPNGSRQAKREANARKRREDEERRAQLLLRLAASMEDRMAQIAAMRTRVAAAIEEQEAEKAHIAVGASCSLALSKSFSRHRFFRHRSRFFRHRRRIAVKLACVDGKSLDVGDRRGVAVSDVHLLASSP